jgi:hypothetical protein
MNGIELVVFASFINWIATTIFVESSLFAPIRDRILRMGVSLLVNGRKLPSTGKIPDDMTRADVEAGKLVRAKWAEKLAMLVTCIMCLGVWVGFAEALYFGGPFGGWAAIVANGLLYKAGGHFIYELRSRVAKP